jgi:hypothetical protein
MAKTSKKRMRATWLQVHKWIGLTLALLIIPISLTGAALVWHDWLDEQLEPQRHQSIAPAGLPASAYADAARAILSSEERITTIRFEGDKPVMVVASKPAKNESARPERTNVWLNPRDARVIDQSPASGGLVQVMHVLHGSLMVPGWGRTIVGWVGAFMFVSCLAGIWRWWPLGRSGAPVSYLASHPIYGTDGTFVLPRGSSGRLPWQHRIDGKLVGTARVSKENTLQFSVDIFNMFNFDGVDEVDQRFSNADILPYAPGKDEDPQQAACISGDNAGCVPKLRQYQLDDAGNVAGTTSVSVSDYNRNFKNTTAYQQPLTVRFGLKVTF